MEGGGWECRCLGGRSVLLGGRESSGFHQSSSHATPVRKERGTSYSQAMVKVRFPRSLCCVYGGATSFPHVWARLKKMISNFLLC